MTTQGDVLSQSEFLQKFNSNQIAHATINFNSQSSPLTPITGTYYKTDKDGNLVKENGKPVEVPFVVAERHADPEDAGSTADLGQNRG